MKYLLSIIFLTSVLATGNAQSANRIENELKICLDSSSNEHESQACYLTAFEEWDKSLNKFYNLYLNQLSSDNKEYLKESQRKWLQYRDAEYKIIDRLYLTELEGSMWRTVAYKKRMDLVKNRALELKKFYETIKDFPE